MTGQMKNPNSYPTVVTNPTKYTGGNPHSDTSP